jgi:multiple sugar transport system permease protein
MFISPWLIGFLVFFLLPIIASFAFSLYDFNLATPDEAQFVGLGNWKRALFDDPEVPAAFLVTFKFALISLPLSMLFALFVAILLNSPNVFGRDVYRTLFYAPTIIPFVASTLIWAGVLNAQTGWINLFLENVLGLPAVGTDGIRWLDNPQIIYFSYTLIGLWGVGNAMMITMAGLQNVPTSLYEAALIDGAGWWSRLWNITLPMISPIIFYNLVLGIIGLMQYFLQPWVLTGGNGYPEGSTRFIMIYFYKQAFTFFNMGYAATLAWLIFGVGVILAAVLFGSARYWVYYAGE